jgi:hypothetical protein
MKIMVKSFRKIIILSCLLLVFSVCITAQTKVSPRVNTSITGVYAGFSLPLIGVNGDMTTYMRTFYFRENGTYVTELDEPDWQTRVDGNYKIIGSKMILQSNLDGDSPSEIEIKENGAFLFYNGASLLKLKAVSSIPSVIVHNNSGASSGGIGTNNIFVAVSSSDLYNFDGRGNFSHNASSASVILGAGVGGGKSRDNSGGGTYTIKDGLLTLNYSNGKVVKKSFFYSESDGDGTALIDGSFHFETDESKKTTPNAIPKINSESKTQKNSNTAIKTLNGAYAGSSLPVFFPGGGSSSSSYRYYFRPNGTYTTELDESNWQTRVDGTYKIISSKVIIQSKEVGEKSFEMDIEEDGASLVYGGNTLFKLNVMNNIPAVVVENSGGASSGGNGTGTTFVGVSFYGVYNFDGKGRFSNNASSSSVISGANVGGGSSNEIGGDGTYTIKDSLLTLTYNNGKVVKKSFFYIEFSHGGTALIDGSLFYEPDKPETNNDDVTTTQPSKDIENNELAKENKLPAESESAQRGLKILKNANYAHGGESLDNLETLRMTGKVKDLDVLTLIDLDNQRVRQEYRKKGVLVLVEQFDGKENWQWAEGKKSKLHEVQEIELKKTFNTGLIGLRLKLLPSITFSTVEVNNQTNIKSLVVFIDGIKHGWIFDEQNRLAAELSTDDGTLQTIISSDFRTVNGVVIPFKAKITQGSKNLEIKFSGVEVNLTFSEKDWAVPIF